MKKHEFITLVNDDGKTTLAKVSRTFKYYGELWAAHRANGTGKFFTVSHYNTGSRAGFFCPKMEDAISRAIERLISVGEKQTKEAIEQMIKRQRRMKVEKLHN